VVFPSSNLLYNIFNIPNAHYAHADFSWSLLFVLSLSSVRRLRSTKSASTSIQLVVRIAGARFKFQTRRNRFVAAESLAHIDHAALTLAVALLQLLASGGERVDEWRSQAVGRFVAFDEDAVAILEAYR